MTAPAPSAREIAEAVVRLDDRMKRDGHEIILEDRENAILARAYLAELEDREREAATWKTPAGQIAKPTRRSRTDNPYRRIADGIADLLVLKQKAYGDSFGRAGQILEVLYPNGVKPSQYGDLLALTRMIDKMFRIANDATAFGESPWRDMGGYSILGAARDEAARFARLAERKSKPKRAAKKGRRR